MFQWIRCPKCKKKTKAVLKANRWVKWIEIYCSECEYRKNVHGKEFDYIQPSSPFFKAIYGSDPIEIEKRRKREERRKKENLKSEREMGLRIKRKRGLLKPWEVNDIKKIAQERNLE